MSVNVMKYLFWAYIFINPLFFIPGQEIRASQEFCFQLSSLILIFAGMLFSKNKIVFDSLHKTVTAFMVWVLVVYTGFNQGWSIAFNIFTGVMVYFTALNTLTKDNIRSMINCVSILSAAAIFYLAMQYFGWDIRGVQMFNNPGLVPHVSFFGLEAAFGTYIALALPLILSFSWVGILLLFPMIFSWSSAVYLAGLSAILFFAWFNKRILFWVALIPLFIAFSLFFFKIDLPMGMMDTRPRMWQLVIEDSFKRPIMGSGLDSFREPKKVGNIRYLKQVVDDKTIRAITTKDGLFIENTVSGETLSKLQSNQQAYDYWDHPHNEFMLVAFETGFIGLGIFIGIIYLLWRRFIRSKMSGYTIGLFSSLVALFVIMQGQFPFHLARIAHLIPILCALFYISTDENKI